MFLKRYLNVKAIPDKAVYKPLPSLNILGMMAAECQEPAAGEMQHRHQVTTEN